MINYLLVLKVCSALDGTCIPEKNISTHSNWFDCARQGTVETVILLDSIGKEMVNKNKLYVAFSCKASSGA
jgi:hypothetical protein|tara:strand:- start:558 stop:770 length:213 start_codon:yes stop_codon:yes gene_type:complete